MREEIESSLKPGMGLGEKCVGSRCLTLLGTTEALTLVPLEPENSKVMCKLFTLHYFNQVPEALQ